MSKDVKIETIYYKSDSDVSLEFGLHGNYPVRLLSSSCNNLTTFFHSLKRAVSRSQIIIIVGGYEGDEYIPSFIARTINKPIFIPEYNKLGVICKQKYPLPEGAVPLCPESKRFAGFLIESGPQTIISLTENKKSRIDTVNEIIVKYIEEHHNYFLNAVVVKQADELSAENSSSTDETGAQTNSAANDVETADTPNTAETDDNEQNTVLPEIPIISVSPVEAETPAVSVKTDDTDVPSLSDETNSPVTTVDETSSSDIATTANQSIEPSDNETESIIHGTTEEVNNQISPSEENTIDIVSHKYRDPESNILNGIAPEDFDFNDTSSEKSPKLRPRRRIIRILCIILSLLIILGTALGVFIHKRNSAEEVDTRDFYTILAEAFKSHGDDYSSAFKSLKEHNEKIEAWISLENSSLDYPVLFTDYDDDSYFDRLPNGSENVIGSVYSYCDIKSEVLSQNVILYGSAKSGLGVFSEIVTLFEVENISDIEPIIFTNSHNRSQWRIFSLFTETEAEGLLFEVNKFESDAKYSAFLNQIIRHTRTDYKAIISDPSAPILMMIAVDGSKRYIACAAPYDTVSYTKKSTTGNVTLPGIGDILGSINDIIDFEGKTEENTGEFEQQGPADPDNVITLPNITVKPPINNNTSSENTVTSSESVSSGSSSKVESDTSSEESSTPSDSSSEETESDTSSSESSNITSSENNSSSQDSSNEEESSKEESSSSSGEASSGNSASTDSPSSDISSSETSGETSSTTSSGSTSSDPEPEIKPDVDPLYTWDVTLYVKQKDGKIIYDTATEIVARVIEAEMGSAFHIEALKAQAVATYAWLLNNGALSQSTAPSGVPMKKNASSLSYQAVKEVKGTLITYNGTIAQTYYCAYSAGYTANVQDIWSTAIPYLQSVECPVDTELSNFITTKTYTADKIQKLILDKLGIDVSEMEKTEWIKPVEYDNNNTYCTKVEIGGVQFKGTTLRGKLLNNGIRSSAYTVEYNEETDSFIITCKGWGHGVGMSQQGAGAYAKQGWTYDQILMHFYPGTELLHF